MNVTKLSRNSLNMETCGCTLSDYTTVFVVLGGFFISEVLPHIPGVEANGIVHFLFLLVRRIVFSDCVDKRVTHETSK